MFYKKGIDITNDKQMFNFLKYHFTYDTLNSWNNLVSIANRVKVYDLHLDGDEWMALKFLEYDNYEVVNDMIYDWEHEHKGYSVGFNGRSGGYLVLYNDGNNRNVLPEFITHNDTYEEYKEYCKEYYGSVKSNRYNLKQYVRLVQDFDKLCDEIRDYVNELSKRDFASEMFVQVIEDFNADYEEEMEKLNIKPLEVVCDQVEYSELKSVRSLYEAFLRATSTLDRYCDLTWLNNHILRIENA